MKIIIKIIYVLGLLSTIFGVIMMFGAYEQGSFNGNEEVMWITFGTSLGGIALMGIAYFLSPRKEEDEK